MPPKITRLFSSIAEILRRAVRPGGNPEALLAGLVGGIYLLTWAHQFTATFGTSLPVVTGLALALALGVELGNRAKNRRPNLLPAAIHFALAVWTLAFPRLLHLAVQAVGRVDLQTLASPALVVLFGGTVALLLLGLPVAGLAALPAHSRAEPGLPPRPAFRPLLAGLALGMLLHTFVLAPTLGIQTGGQIAVLMGLALFFLHVIHATTGSADPRADESPPEDRSPRRVATPSMLRLASLVVLGSAWALTGRLGDQLAPAAGFLVYTRFAALALGALLGFGWVRKTARRRDPGPRPTRTRGERFDDSETDRGRQNTACLLAALWCIALPASFAGLVDLSLIFNAHVSHVAGLTALRSLVAGLIVLPVGFAAGALAAPRRSRRSLAAGAPLTLVAGYLAARWVMLSRWGLPDSFLASAAGLALLALATTALERTWPRRWTRRAAAAACLALLAAGPWLARRYDPARSAKLLFGTDVVMFKLAGFENRLLEHLDEGRPLAVREGDRGTYTLWKHRGVQLKLRESGMPKTAVSTDTEVCPQFSAEMLPAVLPLVIHQHPHRVLLLGAGGGVPLKTCLAFPTQQVTCAEADAALIDLLRRHVWPRTAENPLDYDYLRLLNVDPALALAARQRPYDVIISNPDHSALLRAAPDFTVEFYRRAADRLREDGLFCQRFQQLDYGPQPVRIAARTMQSVFQHVTLIQMAPGELALLGTNSPRGIAREGIVERLRTPHVRRILATLGWDWSTPLKLSVCNQQDLDRFAARGAVPSNTAGNGRFTFSLPQEVMRWGPKARERREALAGYGSPLFACKTVDHRDPEIRRRLSELGIQRELMTEHPDQYWAYRKSVKEQITENPRSPIRQVGFESAGSRSRLHPVDKRRLLYFQALGEAAQQDVPSRTAIRAVEKYRSPYDPLLSYFLHKEVAKLYARRDHRPPEAEFRHRLHAAYFADSGDRSIRNVIAALDLLLEHPRTVPRPEKRWDHLNALLEVLKLRWKNRAADKPTSAEVALNDVDRTVDILERALREMDRLRRELGWPKSQWQPRRDVLERLLLRPLRTYRAELLPHHRNEEIQSQSRTRD